MTVLEAKHVSLYGKRILVVEDDDRLYHALKDSLEDVGCEIFGSCERMSGALDSVPSSHLDAALIDLDPLSMQSVASLAGRLNNRGVPILLITGRISGELPRMLRSYRHLKKPFTERELLDSMVGALDNTD